MMMISSNIAKVVISGTFRKRGSSLEAQYRELVETQCQVLSPRSIDFDDDTFVRSKGEKHLGLKTIQDNHLASIQEADFMWLHSPDGYVGTSGAFEIGYAHAMNVPIYTKELPGDEMLCQYVHEVPSVWAAKQHFLNQE